MSIAETPKKQLQSTPKSKHSPSSVLSFSPETSAPHLHVARKPPKSVKKPSSRKTSSIEASPISAPVSPDVPEPKRRKRSKDDEDPEGKNDYKWMDIMVKVIFMKSPNVMDSQKLLQVSYDILAFAILFEFKHFICVLSYYLDLGFCCLIKLYAIGVQIDLLFWKTVLGILSCRQLSYFCNVNIGKREKNKNKKRVYYKKVIYDGGEFEVGDDVYVKRREDASSDDKDPEVEECRICFNVGKAIMIEYDDCLGGFHLQCLKPPLKEGEIREKTREKLLSSDLWAVRIERGRWYIIPEETAAGRQPHNLRRELYRTNDFADVEMESPLRRCSVMSPKEFSKATNEGDDVFLCEYEYGVHWHTFKRLAEIDNEKEEDKDSESDEECECRNDLSSDSDEDLDLEEENLKGSVNGQLPTHQFSAVRSPIYFRYSFTCRTRKQTVLEKAQATLLLASLPKHLPCRNKEMDDIAAFIKGAICDDQCLGRCLYILGVPGTGKTMIDAGSIKPYCFIEINGLRLASPENIYKVIYEAISGHRVGWRKALQVLNESFFDDNKLGKEDNQPCVLLIDELDLLVTRNQSILDNILDWPTKPHSKLVVIGITNTMDLPEKLLPRISSRMGIQRLCFGPHNYQQLQEIISSRLKGIDAFEKQAVEFASRKYARRALEICRHAAEVADYRLKKLSLIPDSASAGKPLVSMADVEAAIQEMFQAPHIQVMKRCSRLSKIFLTAMVHELYRTGMGETTFEKLAVTLSRLYASNGEASPGWDTLLKVGCKLGECRIIICEAGAKHRFQKLQLNFPSDDVALKDSPELPWLAKFL
ncbi:hypothetical protein AQUCO_00800181v1 [Aquilegia coerulea]|uniref:Origin recognition complex subunit 1 n=1 Tax=Aquilegia coerulea TaxID=218851 RepID=A0A2G5EHN2_AQUCA|nr:hypothetical protein AQUCO_00800181v1 [Aquilegia coerulea]